MWQSVLLIAITALATWMIMHWVRLPVRRPKALTGEEKEIDSARKIGRQLDGARDRRDQASLEGNKLALAKAVKAALWVTESRLNFAVPELLEIAQLWPEWVKDKTLHPPEGVTDIEGHNDPKSPWASWRWNGHHWRLEGEWRPSVLAEEPQEENGRFKVLLDHGVVLDMTISSKDLHVMWIDALSVGPWVSDLLEFAGARRSDAQAISSAKFARQYQDRADKIHWS